MLLLMCNACGYEDMPQSSTTDEENIQPSVPEAPAEEEETAATFDYTDFSLWSGDTALFEKRFYPDGYTLFALHDTQAGTAYISSPSQALRGARWDFRFQMNGKAPSPNSQARVYLASDQADLSGRLHGYFLVLGISNPELTGDARGQYLALCRQDGLPTDTAIIFDCHKEFLIDSYTMLRLRVLCSEQGEWELLGCLGDAPLFDSWGVGYDDTYTRSEYLGFICTYIASQAQNYAFGDLHVRKPDDSR